MSAIPAPEGDERRFLADRMLGTLTRYLRFMGYDTFSANSCRGGDRTEDTLLLRRAADEDRILLTRDRELARRGGERAVYIESARVGPQIRQLAGLRLITPRLRMTRCSLCNTRLRCATKSEIKETKYAPGSLEETEFSWCEHCKKLYWMGSHGRNLERMMNQE
jgi:uncharacterized protein